MKVYDKVGRLYKVTADGGTTTYAYYPTGSRQSVMYPDGTKEEYTYTDDNLLQELKNFKADGSVMDDYTYTYDAAHNQLSKHELVNSIDKGTTSYTYDSLNRLETVTEQGKLTSYTFDKAGNRLSETVTAGGQTVVTTYTYNEQNRLLNTITQNGEETEKVNYIYDNNGNMLAKDRAVTKSTPSGSIPAVIGYRLGQATENYSTIYRYDVWNQLMKTVEADKTVTYSYNGEGYMVEKSVNGSLTRYLYESDKVILETDASGNQTARNVYGTNLISRAMDGQTAWYLYNGHADVTALVSPNGSILASYRYDTWGTIIEENENHGVENPYRYAGYRYESETGLYYLNARYYDSKIARFLSEDTFRGQANDPLSLNLYTYCVNNPLRYWDPTGHASIGIGSRGDGVVAIQEMLNELGYNCGSTDGIFGKNTQAAITQYQKDHGLQVDGIVGNQTLTTLKTNVNVQGAPDFVQQQAMANAAKSQVGGIKDDTILMSTTTFNNTLNTLSNLHQSTGGTVKTAVVVNNQVVVTGVVAPVENKKATENVSANNTLKIVNPSMPLDIAVMLNKELYNAIKQDLSVNWRLEGQIYGFKQQALDIPNMFIDNYNNSLPHWQEQNKLSRLEAEHKEPYLLNNQRTFDNATLEGRLLFEGTSFYAGLAAGEAISAIKAVKAAKGAKVIRTPYGKAIQSTSNESIQLKGLVNDGGELYRGGTFGRSNVVDAQFWSPESPLNPGYANKYGVDFTKIDYVIGGKQIPGKPFITRPAPSLGSNVGGGLEIVNNPGSVGLDFFYMP